MPATSSSIEIDGHKVVEPPDDIGIVFQTPVLMAWRSVLRNIMLPVEVRKLDKASHLARAQALVEMTGLKGFENKFPWQLSGGMQQRAALCRALVHDPRIVLMDEPFRRPRRADARAHEHRAAAHPFRDPQDHPADHPFDPEAVFLADRVIVMTERPGAIAAIYDVDLPRPRRLSDDERTGLHRNRQGRPQPFLRPGRDRLMMRIGSLPSARQ